MPGSQQSEHVLAITRQGVKKVSLRGEISSDYLITHKWLYQHCGDDQLIAIVTRKWVYFDN